MDLYLLFFFSHPPTPPLARTPAELLNQTRHSNRRKGNNSKGDTLALGLSVDVDPPSPPPQTRGHSGFLSDGVLVVWLMDSTLWMVAYRCVSACHGVHMDVEGSVHGSRDAPRMDPAVFPRPCPSVGHPSPAALVFIHNFPPPPPPPPPFVWTCPLGHRILSFLYIGMISVTFLKKIFSTRASVHVQTQTRVL